MNTINANTMTKAQQAAVEAAAKRAAQPVRILPVDNGQRLTGFRLVLSGRPEMVVLFSDFEQQIRDAALFNGFKQKLVDAAAISRDPVTGKSATTATKQEAVLEVLTRLREEARWNKEREGGAGKEGGYLLRALQRLYPKKGEEALRAYLAGKSEKEQATMRADARVAKIILDLKAEDLEAERQRIAAGGKAEGDIFAGLEDDEEGELSGLADDEEEGDE